MARTLLHVLAGLLTVAVAFPFLGRARRQALRARWSRALLGILGIELRAEGVPVAPGCLLVANHISWIDIFVINALAPAAFVSKAEVRTWPVAGWLAARNDTVFLRRGSRGHARIVNAEIAALLDAGCNVAVFPEGTTTEGDHVLHFHGALLQPAIAAGKPVQALALSYHEAGGARSKAPAYVGDTSFGECMQAIVGQRRIVARLHATEPMRTDPDATDRRELARQAHERIAALVEAAAQPATCQASPSSSRTAVSLPPHTQPESSAISPASR
ncbi:1-acyl-sn-glycerol-3-phosphate acyltransferase [Pseudothauera nasutitermitis]|uniref:1-acyl-sn-glycerol-3-phosphate acyltransferase n=1 Tax=Pseudothauera nasutitermitis TaxID=2565930 RepID=A0A4S4AQA8_9RHOO|nr:lysophospholipid acyltransferase family protein [Pseudothauera nasutitermitis]THF61928.1 1-acyl-sn-glycerol-3-phosphate acyltransferase [Pseudothauera nasutitermitis]